MRRANRNRVVVVGGGQAGGRLTQILAAYPHDFQLTLVCQEPHPPYERPPLTKGILTGNATLEHCLIWRKQDDAWRNVDLRLGVSAVAIDRDARSVQISDGAKLDYDVLVLATGSSVRRFSVVGAESGASTIYATSMIRWRSPNNSCAANTSWSWAADSSSSRSPPRRARKASIRR